MNAMQFRTRRYLALDDVRGGPYTNTLVAVVEELPRNRWRPSDKVAPRLVGVFPDGRAVVIEGRNLDEMIGALGAETDDWVGQEITIDIERLPTTSGGYRERKRIAPGSPRR